MPHFSQLFIRIILYRSSASDLHLPWQQRAHLPDLPLIFKLKILNHSVDWSFVDKENFTKFPHPRYAVCHSYSNDIDFIRHWASNFFHQRPIVVIVSTTVEFWSKYADWHYVQNWWTTVINLINISSDSSNSFSSFWHCENKSFCRASRSIACRASGSHPTLDTIYRYPSVSQLFYQPVLHIANVCDMKRHILLEKIYLTWRTS